MSGFFLGTQALAFGVKAYSNKIDYESSVDSYYDRVYNVNSNINNLNRSFLFNNTLVNEQQRRLDVIHQLAKFDNMTEITRNVAQAKAFNENRFGPSADAFETNVARQGFRARQRLNIQREFNLSDISAQRYKLSLEYLNQRNRLIQSIGQAPSSTGYMLRQVGLGLSAFTSLGFKQDKDGNIVTRWGDATKQDKPFTGMQVPNLPQSGLTILRDQPGAGYPFHIPEYTS